MECVYYKTDLAFQYLKDIVGNNQSLLLTFSLNLLLLTVFQLSMAWLLVIQLMV